MKKFCPIIVIMFFIIFSFVLNKPLTSLDELWNYSFSKNIADGLLPYKDFNLVQTPFLFMVTSVFLKFMFDGLITTRILSTVLAVAILIMVYIILNKLIKNKYISFSCASIIGIFLIALFTLDYNFLVLLFGLIILNYELKLKDEKLLKLNIKSDFLIGILAGLAIITKQSTGFLIAFVFVGYKWLLIRDKKDLIVAFRVSLSRGLGVLAPVIIFLGYLFITDSFKDFINFCILGVSEFNNVVPYSSLIIDEESSIPLRILAVMIPVVIAYSIIYLIKNYKLPKEEDKNILILFVYGMANFIVAFPISDRIHFLIGIVILIILTIYIISTQFEVKNKSIKKGIEQSFMCLPYIFLVVFVLATFYNYYKYIISDEKSHNLEHFNYIRIDKATERTTKYVNSFIDEQTKSGNLVYIIDSDAVLYDIPRDKYNKYFNLLLKGNLGKNGSETVIEKIKQLDTNSMLLIRNEKYDLNWQTPEEIINYIKENYTKKIENIALFDLYIKE